MASPNGDRVVSGLALGAMKWLAAAFVLGGVGLALAQGVTGSKVETLKDTAERNQPAIDSIDVIDSRVTALEKGVSDINAKLDSNQRELLNAIHAVDR